MQKRPGRPEGYKANGIYGAGVKTKLMRVPIGYEGYVKAMIIDLPEIIEGYEEKSKDTRNWVEAKKLISEIKKLMEME